MNRRWQHRVFSRWRLARYMDGVHRGFVDPLRSCSPALLTAATYGCAHADGFQRNGSRLEACFCQYRVYEEAGEKAV